MAELSIWTIYYHPLDYPDTYVARRYETCYQGFQATDDIITGPLEVIRKSLELRGLYRLPRDKQDDPCIVESWL